MTMPDCPVCVAVSASAADLACGLSEFLDGEFHGLSSRIDTADVHFDDTAHHLRSLFGDRRPIVAVMASGAVIRLLAPVLKDKGSEPPVLVVSEDGTSIVPLLGGHHGANDMARRIADHLEGHAAITTAGDLRFGVALDDSPGDWVLANPDDAKPVMAALLSGSKVRIEGDRAADARWIHESGLSFDDEGDVTLAFSSRHDSPGGSKLLYHPRDLVVGVGCERGTAPEEISKLILQALESECLPSSGIARVSSIDLKADEPAINRAADDLGCVAEFFDAATLEAESDRLANPSDVVFAEVGCHGVAEGAALAVAGRDGVLVVPKMKSKRATVAIARIVEGGVAGRTRGHLSVLGIGPGAPDWRSPEVTQLIGSASDLVGYSLYLDLLEDLANGRVRHDFPLGKEEDRVRHAMELAGTGRNVALICSGDAGIYAMATLVFELLKEGGLSDAASRINIQISPGISALQAAAARAGAPLGHDFCTISLSDLLTPWDAIKRRVEAAARGDFVIAFYNPVSRRRRTQLAHARDVLLQHRPADTPVILATNLGREGEVMRVVPLDDLNVDDVDMLTVVVVGSSDTRTVKTGDGRTWVYTPRGYSAKEGSRLGSVG